MKLTEKLGARALEPTRPADCLSGLALDRLRAGELGGAREAAARAHVAGCARCAGLLDAATREAGTPGALPPRRMPSAPAPSPAPVFLDRLDRLDLEAARRRRRRVMTGGGALAAAAAAAVLLFHLGPGTGPGTGVRIKGNARLGFYVKHGDDVRSGSAGERVEPGDTIRFTVTTRAPCWVAVMSRDGSGHASVYYPAGSERMAAVDAGNDVALPAATTLDGVPGAERICAFFCERPLDNEPLRLELEGSGAAEQRPPPAGCTRDCLTLDKVGP
jgi:hypothetical protein